jgi:hypothetical protein
MQNPMRKTLEGITLEQETCLLGLKLIPGENGWAEAWAEEEQDQKQFSRQTKLLDGYICLALGQAPDASAAVRLEQLGVPAQENELGKAAVWFAMACRSEDAHTVTMAVYNGFGALGGYEKVGEYADRYLGEAAPAFRKGVEAAKWDEDDSGNSTGPQPGPEVWKQLDLAALRGGLLSACRDMK